MEKFGAEPHFIPITVVISSAQHLDYWSWSPAIYSLLVCLTLRICTIIITNKNTLTKITFTLSVMDCHHGLLCQTASLQGLGLDGGQSQYFPTVSAPGRTVMPPGEFK